MFRHNSSLRALRNTVAFRFKANSISINQLPISVCAALYYVLKVTVNNFLTILGLTQVPNAH